MFENEKTKMIQKWVTMLLTVIGWEDSSKIRLGNNEDMFLLSCDICETLGWNYPLWGWKFKSGAEVKVWAKVHIRKSLLYITERHAVGKFV